jgi:hypothetical protein
MPPRKTYTEMLDRSHDLEVCVAKKSMMGIPAGTAMLISSPKEIQGFIRSVPLGKSVPVAEMRDELAKRHKAEVTCPLTTGIFLRIVAEAAPEDLEKGAKLEEITPFWRVISPKDNLAKKLKCGPEFLEARRAAEGIG